MDRSPSISQKTHFHINWRKSDRLDWESFNTRAEAMARVLNLARPGEMFTIEEVSARCPLCGPKARSAS